MSFTAANILKDASTTLLDPDYVRWPLSELLGYLNDALRDIVAIKPNANTQTVTLTLASGTLQTLPAGYTTLSRVTRNLTVAHGAVGGPVGGPVIRPLKDRSILDALMPEWQSSETLFAKTVKHVIYDLANPRVFYVAPGNDGTGMIEAVVGGHVTPIPEPNDPTLLANFGATVGLPDEYRNLILDFVLYRAFSKDAGIPVSEARAAKHLESYRGSLAAMAQGEDMMALSTTMASG